MEKGLLSREPGARTREARGSIGRALDVAAGSGHNLRGSTANTQSTHSKHTAS